MFSGLGLLMLWLVCGVVTGIIASSKGRSAFGWFFLGCLIGVFALVLVIALPSVKPIPVLTDVVRRSPADSGSKETA